MALSNTNTMTNYLSPKQLAELCRNEIIPKMKKMQYVATLTENVNVIATTIMSHYIDSLSVSRIEADDFADFVEEQAGTGGLYWALTEFWKEVRGHELCLNNAMKRKHVVNAVRHEMTNQIAQCIESVCSDLEDLNGNSGDKLVELINTKTKRALTDSEAQYLRSLVERANNKIVSIPNGDSS